MSALLPGSMSPVGRWARLVGWGAAAVVLGALAATAGEGLDPAGRARLVRYLTILISAGLAVGVQHALYPSAAVRRLQLINPEPGRLLQHALGRWLPVPLVLSVPAVVIAFDGRAPLLAAEGSLSVLAAGLYAFARFASLGPVVRAWEREEAGGWYRRLYTWAPSVRYGVPDALVPGLNRTGAVFLVGALSPLVAQTLSNAGAIVGSAPSALVAPLVVLAVTAVLIARLRATFDRAFWISHGVWADAFRQVERAESREPIRVEAVYWAPRGLRPAVWAGLVSLDRRFPLGRVAALGLALVAAVHLARLGDGVEAASLALYVVVINGAVALSASDKVLPAARTGRLGGVARWSAARFLMNVRWLPPLAGVLLLLIWLAEDVSWNDLAVWTLVDLGAASLIAGLVTLAAHVRFHRAVA
ncbi:hypothetical protein [Rubrivirga marina]|uniref:Uncharacterized protein n=1 Tax=Rubrivirga marina TaxID=1196024 RepID=A0A271IW97_9BACT|nr:hypothetical protein [Rubrivirga marina]PAP75506.1 hypothetical protein BSZ37_03125 [Rubrivirga marina]